MSPAPPRSAPDQALARRVVDALLGGGGELADLFFEDTAFSLVQAEDGKVDRATAGRERGAGLRLVKGGVTRFGSTVDASPRSLLSLARELAGMPEGAAGATPAAVARAGAAPFLPLPEWIEEEGSLPLERQGKAVLAAVEAARKLDPRIVNVRAVLRSSSSRVMVASSRGGWGDSRRSQAVLFVHVVASDGKRMETGYEPAAGASAAALLLGTDPEQLALVAARRALLTLAAPEAPAGRMTVVLAAEAGGTMVHEAVGHGLEADLAGRGMSVYGGRIGEAVASPLVTVVDDPTLPGRRGSYLWDDEGTPAGRTVLVERGVLKGYLNDLAGAERTGQAPNGHGRRQSFRHWPIPRMANTLILPGADDPAAILRSVERGLLVRRMGGGQVNPVTGDFVFEVSEGYLLRGGEVSHPVRGATLAGNGPEVLKSVDMLGDDLGFGIGTCGKDGQGVPVSDAQPTLRIPDIAVGGREGTGG